MQTAVETHLDKITPKQGRSPPGSLAPSVHASVSQHPGSFLFILRSNHHGREQGRVGMELRSNELIWPLQ